MSRLVLMGALAAALVGAPVHAQRNEATLEASVFRGAIGYARQAGPKALVGIEVGFGFPQIDRTLQPPKRESTGEPDFEEYLHVGLFVRLRVSENFEVDTGLRGSVVDLWSETASDTWPELFGGAYVQPMVGWRRVKVGARLTAGVVNETEEGTPPGNTFVVGLAPFLVRATLPW